MKKWLFTLGAVLCFSSAFSQEKSVAIVRHITLFGNPEKQQRLVVSKPDGETKSIQLQQRYSDLGNEEQIANDNQEIIRIFTELINEGYELVESNGNAAGPGTSNYNREIFYIFIKE